MPSSNPLPPKENSLFKRILRCYEHKQYKNGLKFAKQILSNPKYAEHGETLAMKGLTLNCLGRKEEAYEYVRRGLRNDLKSHVCWHVYGLLQRSDKKYDEAIKCYRNALKWEKDNIQILRDLSLLQVQMRDLEGYRDTRYHLFMLRPTQRVSWIGFAMAYHLLNDYETALNILETFRKTQVPSSGYDFEHSEFLLYQNMVIQESGAYEEALKHLQTNKDQIYDKVTIQETFGSLYLKLGMHNEALNEFNKLLERNPENIDYYCKLHDAEKLTTDQEKYDMACRYRIKFPRALMPRRMALNYVTGDTFRNEVDDYMRKGFHKGVPPLFVDLKSLYKDKEKVKIIEDLLQSYLVALKSIGCFSLKINEEKQPASAILWVYYYMAQHYDFLKDTTKALEFIDAAVSHTPTLIELFIVKGQIYKHAGDVNEAYKWMDEAQALDTADRYINYKCAKYMLRANLLKEAEEICSKFTREGVSAMENLNEMQCIWFQTECALAYQRLEKWGEALKKCHEIDRHFSEIIEDQFDFHTYCMRKMTLRSYVGLLRLEDVLRSHPFYFRAAQCAIQVYLRLYDRPLSDIDTQQQLNTENVPPAQLKKLLNKQKKARRKAELEKAQAIAAQEKREHKNKQVQSNSEENESQPQDELIPEKLERVDNPLDQAIKFLKPLQQLASERIETHLMAFEIYYRKDKPLLMLQSIKRAFRLDSSNAELHSCLIRFELKLVSLRKQTEPSVEEPVLTVLQKEMEPILRGRTAAQINKEFLAENSRSLPVLFEGAKMMYLLDPSKQDEAIKLATTLDPNIDDISIQTCSKIFTAFKNSAFGDAEKQTEEYKERCHQKFPYSTIFKPPVSETAVSDTCLKTDSSKFVLESQENCKDNFQENCQEISVSN
ncbi:N-alpha-acetyltransferase 15, NatA auxiliary subunit [Planococcus citri]|uniref:N-alpha-acetyltransferase 15, NatA auxiliary subunit n=1 Tax=Planococcus citri TaxID=170843 RepID=UPI0031F9B025